MAKKREKNEKTKLSRITVEQVNEQDAQGSEDWWIFSGYQGCECTDSNFIQSLRHLRWNLCPIRALKPCDGGQK